MSFHVAAYNRRLVPSPGFVKPGHASYVFQPSDQLALKMGHSKEVQSRRFIRLRLRRLCKECIIGKISLRSQGMHHDTLMYIR